MSRAVWLAGVAALLPVAALSAAEQPAPGALFAPSPAPMLLTRTLRHVMHDGKAVVTRRSYRVQFVPAAGGFRLEGKLTDVSVEAPPMLAAFADLERKRPDDSVFPIQLDGNGLILSAPVLAQTAQQRQAAGTAKTEIARLNLAAADVSTAQGFIGQFQARTYRTNWPLDLFRPRAGTRFDDRTIALPDGMSGQVTTEMDASADPATGLLEAFQRKVTTTLEGTTRVVIEEWTLTPAP